MNQINITVHRLIMPLICCIILICCSLTPEKRPRIIFFGAKKHRRRRENSFYRMPARRRPRPRLRPGRHLFLVIRLTVCRVHCPAWNWKFDRLSQWDGMGSSVRPFMRENTFQSARLIIVRASPFSSTVVRRDPKKTLFSTLPSIQK